MEGVSERARPPPTESPIMGFVGTCRPRCLHLRGPGRARDAYTLRARTRALWGPHRSNRLASTFGGGGTILSARLRALCGDGWCPRSACRVRCTRGGESVLPLPRTRVRVFSQTALHFQPPRSAAFCG